MAVGTHPRGNRHSDHAEVPHIASPEPTFDTGSRHARRPSPAGPALDPAANSATPDDRSGSTTARAITTAAGIIHDTDTLLTTLTDDPDNDVVAQARTAATDT